MSLRSTPQLHFLTSSVFQHAIQYVKLWFYAGGKSIHKAAEASHISQGSPGSSVKQQPHRHISVSAGKHRVSPIERREGRISVTTSPSIARKSGSRKPSQQAKISKRKAESSSGNESSDRPLLVDRGEPQEPVTPALTRGRDRPQVARKSASQAGKNTKQNITRTSPVMRQIATKAARKLPLQHMSHDVRNAELSGSSPESSSDNDSLSSSELSETSTSSTGTRVKSRLDDDIGSRLDVTFASLPSEGSPGGKVISFNNQPGMGPHSHNSRFKSPLPSQCISGIDSHDAEMNVTGHSASAGTRSAEINSPGSNLNIRTTKYSSPPGRSIGSHTSVRQITSPQKQEYSFASTSLDPFPASTGESVPPQPLVEAFENLLVYPLHFHRTNRLPFLLRNIRASFRVWCRDLDIQSQSVADIRTIAYPNIPLTYEYISASGDLYTYETTHPPRQCPLCSLFGAFSSWECLRKHVRWDHSEIECDLIVGEVDSKLVVRMKEDRR